MNISMPPEVRGEPYLCDTASLWVADLPTQHTTLFRGSTSIDELLGILASEMPPERTINIISAGCSYGAEVDTVLALTHKYLPGRVAITGVDGNERALNIARDARYRIGPLAGVMADYTAQNHDFLADMREHGIGVRPYDRETDGPVLNTEGIRQSHPVVWRLGNLASDRIAEEPADLVLCNNVIYHYKHNIPRANAIATNLATSVAEGGILSFGANLRQAEMDSWARHHATPLLAQQGLTPLTAKKDPNLTAYIRLR